MRVQLPDGSVKEFQAGTDYSDIVRAISEGLARSAVCVKVDGELKDLADKLQADCALEVITPKSIEFSQIYWHTASHVLAHAVKRLYPDAKLAIGPSISTGFYYDFDFSAPISTDDFSKIEAEAKRISDSDYKLERFSMTKQEAAAFFRARGESYKLELIDALEDGAAVSMYTQGEFTDLCRGPHLSSTGKIKNLKLTNLTGAYWKGSEKNKMLSRIYAVAYEKKADLDAYLEAQEDAKRRDHNKLGRELGYFMTDENIGQGLVLLMPKGAKVIQILQRFVEDEEARRGYLYTRTPSMAKSDLYKISGHWDHYRDGMFIIDKESEENVLALRPMTCPFQFMIYKNGMKSYRDLPIRYNETATLYRNENSGEMHGLIRVRQFTLSDGHLMVTDEQLEQEFKAVLDLIYYLLECIGLRDQVTFRFSKYDPKNMEKYINNPEKWEETQRIMKRILDHLKIDYTEAEGEAAFYGPKLDLQIKNVFGKEDTIITVQVDFALAERFNMEYTAEDGSKKRPYIIHRSSIGCYERTLALLIEKFAGALPVWLSPTQVTVMSITDRNIRYAKSTADRLNKAGYRAETDTRSEKLGYKIREAQLNKIPFMIILGDKDEAEKTISVRSRSQGDLGTMKYTDFAKMLKNIVSDKK